MVGGGCGRVRAVSSDGGEFVPACANPNSSHWEREGSIRGSGERVGRVSTYGCRASHSLALGRRRGPTGSTGRVELGPSHRWNPHAVWSRPTLVAMNEPRCEVRVAVSPHSRSSSSSAPPSSSTTPATTTPRLTVLLRSHDQDPHCSPWTPASNGGGRMNTRLRSRNQYDAGSASSGTCHVRRNSSRTDSNHPLHYERPEDSAVHHQTKQRRQQFPRTIPELLRHQGGLVSIPQPVLAQCLDPVMRALQELDAMALLNLQTSDHGPCVANG